MKTAILTGFEPFGPYKFNPTQDIAKEFDGATISGVKVRGVILPCSYTRAYENLFDEIKKEGADIVLGCGLASRVPRIRIEAVGRNVMNGKYPDADGKMPRNEKIFENAPRRYFPNTNSMALANTLHEEGIDCEISVDAGTYICNSLIYCTAGMIQNGNLPIKFAYFHTPWTEDYLGKVELEQGKVTIRKSDLKKTVETIILDIAGEL
jgi:pyroglutamyl-peptidase